MNHRVINLLIVLFVLALAAAAPAADQVTYQPAGYTNKWYSGYLNFATGDFHYVFFNSQNNPAKDPIVLWLNGGPGCSSLIGLFTENGPFVFETNSTKLKLNEFSWNKKANVLYIQTPGTVGFSKGKRGNVYNDDTTAQDNYLALVDFFKKFPEFSQNEFYLSGESYAGIYVPTLALEIINKNKLDETTTKINIKGILVGNACTDTRQCYEPTYGGLRGDGMSIFQYEFLHNHDYVTDSEYQTIKASCILDYTSTACKNIRQIVNKKFDQTSTVINNIYQPCYHQHIPFAPQPKTLQGIRKGQKKSYQTCDDLIGILTFLNDASIQKELHVEQRLYDICDDDVQNKYTMNKNASYWIYPILYKEKLRVWVYSGDIDANVPVIGTLKWINKLREAQAWAVTETWRQWWTPGQRRLEDQVGGMVWALKGLTFVSIRGAGHMAPRDKPQEAYLMLDAFLAGKQMPKKSK